MNIIEKRGLLNHLSGESRNTKYFLLIIPCSKLKTLAVENEVPAIDLYDGPFYRIIRKAFRQYGLPQNLDILILSAKYGLIKSTDLIFVYDQRMTSGRARELSLSIHSFLSKILLRKEYHEVFINLGKTYILALAESEALLGQHTVYWAKGQIGERMHQLKNWLRKVIESERSEGQRIWI